MRARGGQSQNRKTSNTCRIPEEATGDSRPSSKVPIFCTDANSTAFKYPLADANLLKLNSGPAVETKLDGTVYDLRTGKVVSWCPKNNPIRAVLGSLKDKSVPEDLAVHSVRLESDGRVKVRLSM